MNIRFLDNREDERGYCFNVPGGVLEYLGGLGDMHVVEIKPATLRGNHYHLGRKEIIVIIYEDTWTLAWDAGADCPAQTREFDGNGAVAVEFDAGVAHALKNTGSRPLLAVSCSDKSGAADDTFRKILIEPVS